MTYSPVKYKRKTIEEMKQYANSKGGICLSKEYVNIEGPLNWQCKLKHCWVARPHDVLRGTWCPDCTKRRKHTIEFIKKLALSKGGKCLSEIYINNKTKLNFECEKGHLFEMCLTHINGHWCQKCSNCAKLSIQDANKLAQERNGLCLSTHYKNNRTPLMWECSHGHIWATSLNNIKADHWCPECNSPHIERKCWKIFNKLTGERFIKIRPNWLTYKTKALELDGYCEKLKLAFEYNGIQHYKELEFFHRSTKTKKKLNFEQIKAHDEFKRVRCQEIGVKLIEIPYWISKNHLESYIAGKIKEAGA